MYASLFISKNCAIKRSRNVNICHKGVMTKITKIIITNLKIFRKKMHVQMEIIMVLLQLVLY